MVTIVSHGSANSQKKVDVCIMYIFISVFISCVWIDIEGFDLRKG